MRLQRWGSRAIARTTRRYRRSPGGPLSLYARGASAEAMPVATRPDGHDPSQNPVRLRRVDRNVQIAETAQPSDRNRASGSTSRMTPSSTGKTIWPSAILSANTSPIHQLYKGSIRNLSQHRALMEMSYGFIAPIDPIHSHFVRFTLDRRHADLPARTGSRAGTIPRCTPRG